MMDSDLSTILGQYSESLNPIIEEIQRQRLSLSSKNADLQSYISQLVYDVFIQDDDEVFEATFNSRWAPKSDSTAFHDFLTKNRASITKRQLQSQLFNIVPRGETTWVTYTCHFTGLSEDEAEVCMKLVLGLKVGLDSDGRRMVETRDYSLVEE